MGRVFTRTVACIGARSGAAWFGGQFPIEYQSIMTPQNPLKLTRRGGLRLLGLFEPDGPPGVSGCRKIGGCLLLERGSGGLKSIQSHPELGSEDRFDFLSQARLCGERLHLIEIYSCEPQKLVIYSTSNHDYHHLFTGVRPVLIATGASLKRHGLRYQE